MPSGTTAQLVDGLLQILIALVIFVSLYKRGKNYPLRMLGLFFAVMGLLNFLAAAATKADGISDGISGGSVAFESAAAVVYYVSIFFGLAIYVSIQAAVFIKSSLAKKISYVAFPTAAALLLINLLPLGIFRLSPQSRTFFVGLSDLTMTGFLILAAAFVAFTDLIMLLELKRQKNGSLTHATNIWTGIGVMMSALLIKRAVDATPSFQSADLLIMIVAILTIAGFLLQISLVVLPGMIYDAKTGKPIPLAMIHVLCNRMAAASAVAGEDGRYELLLMPGEYELNVRACDYKFPSAIKSTYRGEPIKIRRPTILCLDIALDPQADEKSPLLCRDEAIGQPA